MKTKTATYLCVFDFAGEEEEVYHEAGITFFKDGFWITEDRRLPNTLEDNRYWIPPSKILYIRKEYLL